MWTKMRDGQPPNGTIFAVVWHDGSSGYAFLKTDAGEVLGCEDAMPHEGPFHADDLWAKLPDDFELYFMTVTDDI